MAVVNGQQRTHLEIIDDRQIDEKTENSVCVQPLHLYSSV